MSILHILVLVVFLSKCLDAKNCTCVPFYQCGDNFTIISDGRRLISGRLSDECEGFLNFCCTYIPPTPISPTKPKIGCGTQPPENFPWSAALYYKQYPNFVPSYKCRVSLIHEQVAVTAAHCLEVRGYYQIKINSTIRGVRHIHLHPSFSLQTLQNDIALLILNRPFHVGKFGHVCIPPPGAVLTGTNCTTITQKNNKNNDLRVIAAPVVDSTECVEKLRKTALGKFFHLHESFICAGGGEHLDTCDGDGGSPLICPVPGVPGRYQQGGIVSWGIECDGSFPGMYVNLAYFREWIDEIMVKTGFGIHSYRI